MKPGAGRMSASRLNFFNAASIPRVAPRSLSNARAWKNVAFLPVVASDSMRLYVVLYMSYTCSEDGKVCCSLALVLKPWRFFKCWIGIVECD